MCVECRWGGSGDHKEVQKRNGGEKASPQCNPGAEGKHPSLSEMPTPHKPRAHRIWCVLTVPCDPCDIFLTGCWSVWSVCRRGDCLRVFPRGERGESVQRKGSREDVGVRRGLRHGLHAGAGLRGGLGSRHIGAGWVQCVHLRVSIYLLGGFLCCIVLCLAHGYVQVWSDG